MGQRHPYRAVGRDHHAVRCLALRDFRKDAPAGDFRALAHIVGAQDIRAGVAVIQRPSVRCEAHAVGQDDPVRHGAH